MARAGIAEEFRTRPTVKSRLDSGYQGLADDFPDQVSAPPKKPADEARGGYKYAWQEARRPVLGPDLPQAHQRRAPPVGTLCRFTGRRDTNAETHHAIAGLVSDRAAQQATRRLTGTELVLIRHAAC